MGQGWGRFANRAGEQLFGGGVELVSKFLDDFYGRVIRTVREAGHFRCIAAAGLIERVVLSRSV